jgi:hypothetical protein
VDELQDRLARIGLGSLGEYGFALAGGYALQAHGLVQRVSEDVDLFTDRWDVQDFAHAVEAVRRAWSRPAWSSSWLDKPTPSPGSR